MFQQWFQLNKDLSIALYFTNDMFRQEENWIESPEEPFCTKSKFSTIILIPDLQKLSPVESDEGIVLEISIISCS